MGKTIIKKKRKKEKGKETVPPSAILSKGHFVCESERGVSSGQGDEAGGRREGPVQKQKSLKWVRSESNLMN